ncbi:hypothetical protein QP199_25235, partial [Escherichia coli]|nr:hypothetical protein [Escherichia coli]
KKLDALSQKLLDLQLLYICNKVILGISSCFPLLYKVILSHYTVNKKGKAIILLVYLHTIKKA